MDVINHTEVALSRLLQQYKDKPNLEAIISVFTEQCQEIETALHGLYGRLNIDNSVGTQLDGIGSIVGIEREGRSDAVYRIFIKGKIATNISRGTPENIINVFKILSVATSTFLSEIYPASIAITSNGLIATELRDIVRTMLERAISAGVSLDHFGYFPDNPFSFYGSSDGGGFGSLRCQGDTTSASAFKLIDSGNNFISLGVLIDDIVYNNIDGTKAVVTAIDSSVQLTLDTNIFSSTGINYYIAKDIGGELGFLYV